MLGTFHMSQILDGRILAAKMKEVIKQDVKHLVALYKHMPSIISILIGEEASASIYVGAQQRMAENVGFRYELKRFSTTVSQAEILYYIKQLNTDQSVTGVIIQTPVPKHIDHQELVDAIDPYKDIEGVNVVNIGKLVLSTAKIIPCTAASALELIKSSGVPLRGKEVVIVGRSEIVGKPLSFLLLQENTTVTICHSGTSEAGKLVNHLSRADIVVSAVGKPNFIQGHWIKEGAMVIDVGINEVNGKIIGDVEFESASQKAGYITPVPGGVGPVTVMMLMKNCCEAFKLQWGK